MTNTNLDARLNQEIDDSFKFGAKAFAFGTVLIVVFALAGVPAADSGDAAMSGTPLSANASDTAAAPAPAPATDAAPATNFDYRLSP
ncbi:MAG: hypothetical protein ABI294_03445 [Casimicrobiaceae bacterium]